MQVLVVSEPGVIGTSVFDVGAFGSPSWRWYTIATKDKMPARKSNWEFTVGYRTFLRFPHRLPIAVFALAAAAPWIRWRFSLRTLFIAVTAIAVGLWFIVWLAQ